VRNGGLVNLSPREAVLVHADAADPDVSRAGAALFTEEAPSCWPMFAPVLARVVVGYAPVR
jgi:hypothetical protein